MHKFGLGESIRILEGIKKSPNKTVHGWVGTTSILHNLWFTNPLIGQPRFFGDTENALGGFVPDKFIHKRKSDKRNYRAIVGHANDDVMMHGTTIIMMEPSDTFGLIEHYFHFCEHLVSIWNAYSIWKEHNINPPVNRVILLSCEKPRWDWEGINSINKYLLRALFPYAQVLTYDHLKKMAWRKNLKFERVIASDRAIANREGEGKMLKGMLPFISRSAIRDMATKVHESLGTTDMFKRTRKVYLSTRAGERSLTPEVIKELYIMIRSQGLDFVPVDFAKYSFPKQLQMIRDADVLMGVHGNGLTHSLFLSPHAKVIEIFPPGSHLLEYRMLCEAAGIQYHGLDPYQGEYSKKKSYEIGEVFGNHTKIQQLPMDLIRRLV